MVRPISGCRKRPPRSSRDSRCRAPSLAGGVSLLTVAGGCGNAAPGLRRTRTTPLVQHRHSTDIPRSRPLAKPEWGTKRICPSCGARYYDLRKNPPACPSCGTVFDPEALLKSRRARPMPVDDTKAKKAPVVEDEEVVTADEVEVAPEEEAEAEVVEGEEAVEEIETEEEDDVLLEDADELSDEDDVGEVVDVEGEEER